MKATYLFYDIETTGLNPCFDQILQFAAIRTDEALNEIERYEYQIRLNCDVNPHPEAMAVHGLSLEDISQGDNEFEAITAIHRLLNTPGTISLGYNTLGFDDEFLRFSFYRNLLSPYTHQYAQGCQRMDLYPITLLYYLFKPQIIKWPEINSQISLKLEHLNQANQFISGRAHQAIVDVEATVALARAFYQERKMWDYLCGYFNKQKALQRLSTLSEGLVLSGRIGAKHHFLAPALSLGTHRIYKNQNLWLRLDHEDLTTINESDMVDTVFVFRQKIAETPIILPNQPRFVQKIASKRWALAKSNQTYLKKNETLFKAIQQHYQYYTYPKIKNIDADAALYTLAFPTDDEQYLFHQFHQACPSDKQTLLNDFSNAVYKEQALRILGRHYPEFLTLENQQLFETYLKHIDEGKVIDYKGQYKLVTKLS